MMYLSKKEKKVLDLLRAGKSLDNIKKRFPDLDLILDTLKKINYVSGTRPDDTGWIFAQITNIGEMNLRNKTPRCVDAIDRIKKYRRLLSIIVAVIIIAIYITTGCKITDGFSAIDCARSILTGQLTGTN